MLVQFDHISKSYGKNLVYSDFSATIDPGQLLVVLGVNGAGKTTLLRMISGLTGYHRGNILFNGRLFKRNNLDQRRQFCFLSETPFFFPDKSILENISIYLFLWEVEKNKELEEKIMQALDDFDLLEYAHQTIETLSRGLIFKAAMVALIAVDPNLWLIDEPFASGMDPQGISMFRKYSRDAAKRGKTVIYTTQLLELAETFSDRIWVIHHGTLVANNSATNLKKSDVTLEHLFSKLRTVAE